MEWLLELTFQIHSTKIFFKAYWSISQYYVKNCPVAIKNYHKDVGISMSTDLSWRNHYDYLLSKACKTIGLFRRTLARSMSIHTKKVLYYSLIRSMLTYSSPIWCPHYILERYAINWKCTKMSNQIYSAGLHLKLQKSSFYPSYAVWACL